VLALLFAAGATGFYAVPYTVIVYPAGMWMLHQIPNPATKHEHFGGSAIALSKLGFDSPRTLHVGFLAVAVNLVVAALVTVVLKAAKVRDSGGRHVPRGLHR
jgi:SSS family solute:Na+ symporter